MAPKIARTEEALMKIPSQDSSRWEELKSGPETKIGMGLGKPGAKLRFEERVRVHETLRRDQMSKAEKAQYFYSRSEQMGIMAEARLEAKESKSRHRNKADIRGLESMSRAACIKARNNTQAAVSAVLEAQKLQRRQWTGPSIDGDVTIAEASIKLTTPVVLDALERGRTDRECLEEKPRKKHRRTLDRIISWGSRSKRRVQKTSATTQ